MSSVRPGGATGARPRWRLAALAAWLLVIAPVAVLPGGLDRFTFPSVVVGYAGVLGAALAPASGRLPRWAVAVLGAGTGLLLLAALTSASPWASMWGRWPRYEGLVVLPLYVAALWAGARLLGPGGGGAEVPRGGRTSGPIRLTTAVAVLAILLGAVSLAQAFGLPVLESAVTRPGAQLGNATDQGLVAMIATLVLTPHGGPAVRAVRARGRSAAMRAGSRRVGTTGPDRPWLTLGGVAAAVVTVGLSGSRAAVLGTLVGLAVLAAVGVNRLDAPGSGPRWRGAAGAGVVGGLVVTAALGLAGPRLTGADVAAAGSVEGRLLLWRATVDLVRDAPWTGTGPSTFVDAIAAHQTREWALAVGSANPPDSPHAWPLQAAVAGGVPLAILAIAAAVSAVVTITRRLRTASGPAATHMAGVLAVVIAYGLAAGTHPTTPGVVPLVALLAGSGLAVPARSGARAPHRTAVTLAAAALVVAVPATVAEWPLAGAVVHLAAGDVAASNRSFEAAHGLRRWDADTAMLAAHAFAQATLAGEPRAAGPAGTWAARALDRVPDSLTARAAAAVAAEAAGDLAEAAELLDAQVNAAPADPEWRLRRGVVLAERGDLAGAEADFLTAADLAPGSPQPWWNLAALYRLAGDEAAASAAEGEAVRRE